jgi:hypothetical protein
MLPIININFRIFPFGQIILELGKPDLSNKDSKPIEIDQKFNYYDIPKETVPSLIIYELRYDEKPNSYFIPLTTCNF